MMTDPADPARPVPRWLRAGAVLAVAVTLFPLVLGQIVTSVRAGMADPAWPTEPWYLVNNFKVDFGYLIEHSHRIAGYIVGSLFYVLTLGFWWTDPRPRARWGGVGGLVALIVGYLLFHGAMRAQGTSAPVTIPEGAVGAMAAGLFTVIALGLVGITRGIPGAGLRLLAVVALVALMIQGLLGGFRVKLNALVGTDLAAVHGVFAQVVFCLLVAVAVLTARPIPGELPASARRTLGRLSLALVGLLFVQLVWGAMVRHAPDSLNQRLHLLTAFLVVAAGVWLLRVGFSTPAARPRVAPAGRLLGVLLALQVALGVEAWMGKFGEEAVRAKPPASRLPEAERVDEKQATLRTAHTLVGTGVLAAAVALAVQVRRRIGTTPAAAVPESGETP